MLQFCLEISIIHFKITTVADGILSESPGSVDVPPDPTSTDGMDRDNRSTQASSEPQRSDNIPRRQNSSQSVEDTDLAGINFLPFYN